MQPVLLVPGDGVLGFLPQLAVASFDIVPAGRGLQDRRAQSLVDGRTREAGDQLMRQRPASMASLAPSATAAVK